MQIIAKVLALVPLLQKDFEADQKLYELMPPPPAAQKRGTQSFANVSVAIIKGQQKYTNIHAPILAVFASPHSLAQLPPMSDEKKAEYIAIDQAKSTAQAKAFEKLESAKVITIPNADHYVFSSNEQEVEKDIKDFLGTLKSQGN